MGRLLNFLINYDKIEEDGEGGGATTGSVGGAEVPAGGGTTTDHIAIYAKKLMLARRWNRKRSKLKKRKRNEVG